MKNPYVVPTSQTVLMRVHKDLALAIKRETKKQQRFANLKFGSKFKVKGTYGSKILGGLLK